MDCRTCACRTCAYNSREYDCVPCFDSYNQCANYVEDLMNNIPACPYDCETCKCCDDYEEFTRARE